MRLVGGRLFEPSDLERGEAVVVLNETAASRLWPDADPIGKRVNIDFAETVWREVVGVVQDVKARGLGSPARAESYSPMIAVPFGPVPSLTMTLRTTLATEQIRASVQEVVAAIDPRIPMGAVQSMTAQVDASMAGERFLSSLLAIFSAAALLLGSVGVYGSMGIRGVPQDQRDRPEDRPRGEARRRSQDDGRPGRLIGNHGCDGRPGGGRGLIESARGLPLRGLGDGHGDVRRGSVLGSRHDAPGCDCARSSSGLDRSHSGVEAGVVPLPATIGADWGRSTTAS